MRPAEVLRQLAELREVYKNQGPTSLESAATLS